MLAAFFFGWQRPSWCEAQCISYFVVSWWCPQTGCCLLHFGVSEVPHRDEPRVVHLGYQWVQMGMVLRMYKMWNRLFVYVGMCRWGDYIVHTRTPPYLQRLAGVFLIGKRISSKWSLRGQLSCSDYSCYFICSKVPSCNIYIIMSLYNITSSNAYFGGITR